MSSKTQIRNKQWAFIPCCDEKPLGRALIHCVFLWSSKSDKDRIPLSPKPILREWGMEVCHAYSARANLDFSSI